MGSFSEHSPHMLVSRPGSQASDQPPTNPVVSPSQATITTMTKELRTLQVQFEEAISTHQREAETLREKLRELAAERSSMRREVRWISRGE